MGLHDSDDESLSISLPSNNENTNNLLSTYTLTDTEKITFKKDNVRNTLKKQILRILSTDDEEELDSTSEGHRIEITDNTERR